MWFQEGTKIDACVQCVIFDREFTQIYLFENKSNWTEKFTQPMVGVFKLESGLSTYPEFFLTLFFAYEIKKKKKVVTMMKNRREDTGMGFAILRRMNREGVSGRYI